MAGAVSTAGGISIVETSLRWQESMLMGGGVFGRPGPPLADSTVGGPRSAEGANHKRRAESFGEIGVSGTAAPEKTAASGQICAQTIVLCAVDFVCRPFSGTL
jgi:hypothetical protein